MAITAYASAAGATDELNCHSATWAVAIAVGTHGYVNSLLVQSKAPSEVHKPVVVINFVGKARHVDARGRVVDVKASAPNGEALNIRLKDGKGHIQYLGTVEQLDCDWTI